MPDSALDTLVNSFGPSPTQVKNIATPNLDSLFQSTPTPVTSNLDALGTSLEASTKQTDQNSWYMQRGKGSHAVIEGAQSGGYDPAHVMAIVGGESGGNPRAQTGSYYGVAQLGKSEVESTGNNWNDYKNMDARGQMQVAVKHWQQLGVTPQSGLLGLAMAQAAPAYLHKALNGWDGIVYPKGSKEYNANRRTWVGPDGEIRPSSITAYYAKQLPKQQQSLQNVTQLYEQNNPQPQNGFLQSAFNVAKGQANYAGATATSPTPTVPDTGVFSPPSTQQLLQNQQSPPLGPLNWGPEKPKGQTQQDAAQLQAWQQAKNAPSPSVSDFQQLASNAAGDVTSRIKGATAPLDKAMLWMKAHPYLLPPVLYPILAPQLSDISGAAHGQQPSKTPVTDLASGLVAWPVDVAADAGIAFMAHDATPLQRIGAVTNVILKTDPMLLGKPLKFIAGARTAIGEAVSDSINSAGRSMTTPGVNAVNAYVDAAEKAGVSPQHIEQYKPYIEKWFNEATNNPTLTGVDERGKPLVRIGAIGNEVPPEPVANNPQRIGAPPVKPTELPSTTGNPVDSALDAYSQEAIKSGVDPKQVAAFKPQLAQWFEQAEKQGRPLPKFNKDQLASDGALNQAAIDPLGFYSKLQDVFDTKVPNKATGAQVKATLLGNGVKPEELNYVIGDYLDQRANQPIVKSDLQAHIEDNAIHVKETTLGGTNPFTPKDIVYKDLPNGGVRAELPNGQMLYEAGPSVSREWVKTRAEQELNAPYANPNDPTKFSQYTTPGGNPGTYRELLLTLGEKKPEGVRIETENGVRVAYKDGVEIDRDTNLRALRERVGLDRGQRDSTNFQSSHFDQPNILAHVRFDDRTGPNGEKILHVAEIQSDMHQQGREKGYVNAGEKDAINAELRQLNKQTETNRQSLPEFAEANKTIANYKSSDADVRSALDKLNTADRTKFADHYARIDALNEKLRTLGNAVPDAPFKKTWHELAMRRILNYASEHGYDKVTWDTGATQAERYDLSKQVSRIHLSNPVWGEGDTLRDGDLIVTGLNGNDIISESKVTPKRMEEIIGKEATNNLIHNPTHMEGRTHVLEGDGLRVGGAGMKGFYDKILPDYANKYTKKWGGRVEDESLGGVRQLYGVRHIQGPEYGVYNSVTGRRLMVPGELTRDEAVAIADTKSDVVSEGPNVHSLTITPEMRESILNEGQPLFQGAKGSFTPKDSVVKFVQGKADLSTVIHETAHWFEGVLRSHPEWGRVMDEAYGTKLNPGDKGYVTQAEKFARQVESYFRDPNEKINPKLKPAFQAIVEWMRGIYEKFVPSASKGMDPKVRAIFDEIHGQEPSARVQKLVDDFNAYAEPPPVETPTVTKNVTETPTTPANGNLTGISNEAQVGAVERGALKATPKGAEGLSPEEAHGLGAGTKSTEAESLAADIKNGRAEFSAQNVSKIKHGSADLESQIIEAGKKYDEARDGNDLQLILDRKNEYDALRTRYQNMADDLQKSKTEWSNIGKSLQGNIDLFTGKYIPSERIILEAEREKGMPLSDKERTQISKLVDERNTLYQKEGESQNVKDKEFQIKNAMDGVKKAGPLETIRQLYRAGLVSSLGLPIKVYKGFALGRIMDSVSALPASWFDTAISKITKQRASTADVASVIQGIKDVKSKTSIGRLWKILTGKAESAKGTTAQMHELHSGNKVIDDYVNSIFRAHSTLYTPILDYGYGKSIAEQARLESMNQGKPELYKSLIENPTKDMQDRAHRDAAELLLLNENKAGKWMSRTKAGGAADLALTTLSPVPTVASNVAGRILEHSPLGQAKAISEGFKSIKEAKAGNMDVAFGHQREASKAFGRSAAGTFGLLLLGYQMAKNGLITGTYPRQGGDGRTIDQGGYGNVRVPVTPITPKGVITFDDTPQGKLATIGAQWYEAEKNGKTDAKEFIDHLTDASSISDLFTGPIVDAASQISKMVERPGTEIQKYGENVATGAVPSFLGSIAKVSDLGHERKTENLKDKLKAKVPGLRQTLQEK